MKTLKSVILIVLMLAIGVCGYMVYQEYFETKETQEPQEEQTELYSPEITQVNDSTYHVNLSECSCINFEAHGDTVDVDGVGVNFIKNHGDTIRVGVLQTYVLSLSDFYDSVQFKNINLRLPGE